MWATLTDARTHWPDSADLTDERLAVLLEVASKACESYAPDLTREVSDAVIELDSTTLTSDTAGFSPDDEGAEISGDGIPAGAIVSTRVTRSKVTLSSAATDTSDELTVTITRPLPTAYMLAAVYQARELYAATLRGEGDVIGIGDYAIRARPLTAPVKQLLRPQQRLAVG